MSENNISAYRKYKNLSQTDLAKMIGTSRATVSRWENGTTTPTESEWIMIAEALGVTVSELLEEGKSPNGKTDINDILTRISDGIDNLVSGQETIKDEMRNTSERSLSQDEISLRSDRVDDIFSEMAKIRSQQEIIDSAREARRHRRIRTAAIIIACIIVVIFVGIFLYILRNLSLDGVYYYTETVYEVDINEQ